VDREALAWAAGFFDGEGCFFHGVRKRYGNSKGGPYHRTETRMTQAHPAVLERFREVVGLGQVYGPYAKQGPRDRPQWQYVAYGWRQTQAIIALLWPWIGEVKRLQAKNVLRQVRENPPRKPGRPPKLTGQATLVEPR
jgi:hypothetical protein